MGIDTSQRFTRLILIRHGHTAANGGAGHAPMAGWTDLPLTARGGREAERLRQHLTGGAPFDGIYASPLARTHDTARVLADAGLGLLHLRPELREINCGAADGLPVDEVKRRFPEAWQENREQDREDFRWPGGESYRELRDRCLRVLRQIAGEHHGGRVAVVTHAGVISQVVGWIRGVSPACWERYRPGNASITEVAWGGSRAVVLAFDRRSHLDGPA